MRNLKRALSLALASIMLLGMMVTGAGAASNSFTDFDQIVNQEAAEVTSGLGIFDGYTDGSFGPENVVTRAEMAVIICKLLNGSDVDPGNFTGISKFTDVPAWAEGYVNYCAASGIVVGVGEGKFNPSATVTTVEAATMLLKALGYFTEEDQLKADWKTVVTGRATSLGLYGDLVLKSDEGLTRDNVAELVFHTLFAQRVAYDDNRQLYVKNTNRDVVVTNGTIDPENTFAKNTFGMWYVDGIVTANSYTDDGLSETVNNAPRTNVEFDERTDMGNGPVAEYAFEYTTGLDMIAHAARVYYSIERKAPVVYAIADRATKVEFITYDSNTTRLSETANEQGFRKNSVLNVAADEYKVNYDWDRTVGALAATSERIDLTGKSLNDANDPAKTLLLISNSSDFKVDYVIVLDQYLDTVRRVTDRNDTKAYDMTTVNGDRQNVAMEELAEGDYVIVTDIGKSGDMLILEKPEQVSASISKITGISDKDGTVKGITADGTEYKGSPVYDHKVSKRELDNVTDFEDITTVGATTLLLDNTLGKCIGLAQAAAPEMYAYVAQYAEKHVPGFGTEYRLVAKLFLSDGTEGVYEINTDAGTVNTNSFKDYQYTKNNNALLHALNGKDSSGHVTATRVGNRSTYDATKFNMSSVLSDFTGSTSGLGVFKATVRADGTVVLAKLSGTAAAGGVNNALFRSPAENANRADIAKAKAVTGHSTLIATVNAGGMQAGKNVTNGASPDQALYQTGKTVFFYINGQWGDGADQADLTVGVETGIDKMKKLTSGDDNDIEEAPYRVSGTTTGYEKKFLQVFSVDSNSNYDNRVEGRREVNAELIYGVSYTNDNLYFYHRGNYTVDWVNGSRADGEKASITFEMYDVDGNRVDKTYDNGGKYFEEVEIRGMVDSKETGWYTFGAEDLKQIISFNGVETVYDGSEIYNSNSTKWSSLISNKMFVINADVDHVDYENNIYTTDERVGGITKDAVIVDVTGTGLFDDARDIDSACRAGHKVLISYYYNTTGNDAYKVKAVFVTGYDPYENPGNDNRQGDVYSVYNSASGRLNVYDNGKASRMDVMNSAVRAYQDAGFTVTNAYPTMFGGRYWGMTITREGWTPRYVTNDPNATGNNNSYVANSNYYMDEVDALNAVFVSSSRSENYRFAAYRLSGENYTYAVNNPYYATYTVKYAGTDTALTGYSDVMLGTNSQGNVNVRYPSNGVMQDSYDIYLTLKTSGTVDEDNFATLTAGYPAGITVDNEAYTAGKKLSVGQHGFNVTMDSAEYYTVFVNGAIVESTASAGTAGKKVVSFQAELVKGGNTISIQASDKEFSGGTLNITPKDATVKDDQDKNVTWANNASVAVGTYTVTATVDKGDEYVVTVNGTKLDSTSVKTAANGADSSKMDLTFSVSVVKGKTTVVEAESVTYQGTLNIDPAKNAVVELKGTDVKWSEKNNKLKVGTYSVTVVVPKGDGYSVTNNGINVSSVTETADGNNMKLTFSVTIAKDQTVNIKAVSQTKGDGIKVETTADTNKVPKGAVLTVADVSSEDNQTLSEEDIDGKPVNVKVDLSKVASANRGITGNTFDENTFYWVQINNVAFGPVKGNGTSELVFRVILTIEQVQNNTLVLEELFQSESEEIKPDLPADVIEKAPEKVAPFTVKSAVIYNQKTLEDADTDKIINIDQFVGGSGWTSAEDSWKTLWLNQELTPQPSFAIRLIKTGDFENSKMSFKMTGIEIGGKKYNMNQWKDEDTARTYTWVKENYNDEAKTERWFQVAILKDMILNEGNKTWTAPSNTGDAISINKGDEVVVYLEYDGIEIPVEGVYGGVNLTPEIRESYKTTGKPPVEPGDTEITSITVTNSTGKVEDGKALDETVENYKVAEEGITIKNATWAEKTAAPTARATNAVAGKTYTLTLSVEVADGKTVSDKAAIKVNVGGVEVTGKYTATPGTRAVTSGTITADFTVPAKDTQPTEINKITIANTKGKVEVGQELDTTVDNYEVSKPKTGLTITKVDWARKKSGSSRASAEAGDYTLTLTVSLADGVTVADNANITITAGGLTGTNGKFEATQTGRAATTGTITADFTLTNTQSEGGNGGGGR